MNDIDFPSWIATSPSLAMASVLGRTLQRAYAPQSSEALSLGFRTGSAGHDRDGRSARSQEHRRAKLMLRAVKGEADGVSSSSSSSFSDGSTGDSDGDEVGDGAAESEDDALEAVYGVRSGRKGRAPRRRHRHGLADTGAYDDGDDAFYSVASSSSNSEYDPMERPHLRTTTMAGDAAARSSMQHPAHKGTRVPGHEFALVGFGPRDGASYNAVTPRTYVDILHDPRVQRLLRLSCINELCSGGGDSTGDGLRSPQPPMKISSKHAVGIIALFALAVECRALPSDATKGFYTECGSLYTTLLGLLRDGIGFCDGVDVEGFVASLVACGLKMRTSAAEEQPSLYMGGDGSSAGGGLATPGPAGGSSTPGTTPRGRNIGLSGFDPRIIDTALAECIPADIDACAGSFIALGTLQGLACTLSRRPVYLSPSLVNHLHNLTDAFATSPNRRELSYKKLLSLLLEAMSCSLVIDYERTNNWITAIIQEAYVVRGLFQKEILHARVVAATLTLLIRQYQEMAAEYAATCGSVDGMPDFSEGDQLIDLVWRALQDALQGWSSSNNNSDGGEVATGPTKPQTLYGANLRVVVENVLRMEVERLRCFHVITCASTAYQQRVLSMYTTTAGAAPPAGLRTSPQPPVASPTSNGTAGISSPLLPKYFPEKGKKRKSTQQKKKGAEAGGLDDQDTTDDVGYTPYFPSDEEEVLRVRVVSNIVRFLLLPTSVLNVLPRGEATTALRADLISQCSQVLTLVSAKEFAEGVAHRAADASTNANAPSAAAGRNGASTTTSLPTTPRAATGSAPPPPLSSSQPFAHGTYGATQRRGPGSTGARQRAQFSNGYYRNLEGIVHELIRVLVKGGGGTSILKDDTTRSRRRDSLPTEVITAVEGSATAAEACLQSLCASDAQIRAFAVSEVIDAVVRVSGNHRGNAGSGEDGDGSDRNDATGGAGAKDFAALDAQRAKNLAPCFAILCNIVVPRQYTLTHAVPRKVLARYVQLLCDTYTDSLRACLDRRTGSADGGGVSSSGRQTSATARADATAFANASTGLPTPVMKVVSTALWHLVTRVHERLSVIAQDAVRLSRWHQQLARTGRAQHMSRSAKRAAALERARYVRLLNAENVSIRQLILAAMRCMLGVAWPGSGVLYQRASPAAHGTPGWSGERRPDASTEPGAMAPLAITCIDPFLKPLSLLLALSTLFPIRSLRNKGLAAHAEHARYLAADAYRENYLFYYYYRPTTKTDDGEAVNASTVEDADALLDASESRHYLSEFRSLWLLMTYYGFSSEALSTASALRRKLKATSFVFYDGEKRLTDEQATALRHIAASAAPLLQMRSSDMHQSVADITSLERYMGRHPLAGSHSSGGAQALAQSTSAVAVDTGRGPGVGGFDTHVAKKDLQRVMKRICGGSSHWEKLTAEELFLLRSLLDLEMLRASSGSIANLTLYLHFEVREFVASPAIRHVIQHVVAAVCTLYVDTLKTFLPRSTYQLLAKDIHQLVLLLSFSLASVRVAATMVLERILDAFPVLSAYTSGLQLLWAVINVLESGSAAQVESFCRRLHFNAVPAVAADPTSDDRREQVQALVQLAERWADKARKTAPLVLFQSAAKFVVGQSVMGAAGVQSLPMGGGTGNGTSHSSGFTSASQLSGSRLAVKAAAEQTTTEDALHDEDTTAATGVLAVGATAAPNYAQSLIKYSNAQGQVLSAVRVSAFASVEAMVVGLLRDAMQASILASPYQAVLLKGNGPSRGATRRHPGNTSSDNNASRLYEADSLMCSSVALLTTGFTSASSTVELLRFITQGPIRVFDNDYIRAAMDGWSWLLANDRERFTVPLLEQVAEGIQWTLVQGLGIFDGARPSQNVEVQTGEGHGNSSSNSNDGAGIGSDVNAFENNPQETRRALLRRLYPSDYASSSPHKLLIAFLADTYADPGSPWSLDPDVLLALYNLASAMVQYPSRLSLKDASFAETMRLFVLIGHICRHLHTTNTRRQKAGEMVIVPYTSIATLRQRWYACLLQWFRKAPPSWYFANSPSLAKEEIPVLEALVRLLRDEESAVGRNALGFLDFSVGVAKEGDAASSAPPPVNIWSVASAARERVETIRRGDSGGREAAMNVLVQQEQTRLRQLLKLLRVLVQHEHVRLQVWQSPRRTLLIPDPLKELSSSDWSELVDAAAAHDPAAMVALATRFPGYPAVHKACVRHVVQNPERFASVPEAVDLYITRSVLAAGAPKLFLFNNCTIIQALRYLDASYVAYPQVSAYAIRSLLSQKSEYLIFYLPQLLQVLATDSSGRIQDFLLRMSRKSLMFCHQLLWCLQTEGEAQNTLGRKCQALETKIRNGFDETQRTFYEGEFAYTKLITSLSGELMSVEKPQRKPKLRLRLQDAEFHDPIETQHLYLPTDAEYRIVGVIPRTAGAMQSAAKCPILVQFQCVRRDGEDTRTPQQISAAGKDGNGDDSDGDPNAGALVGAASTGLSHHPHPVVKACIFKMGDDCRQDQISLQLIGLMKRILDSVGVPSYLYPYRVVTTGQDSGIIEVVPKSMSRNEIGKLVESNLAEFYVQTFGHPESVRFHRARDNFVKSVASYSVVSFILNIKDRHNGNIMIDSEGHLVHIDFGFLFDTSPGGDMNFESSPFKLTTEMIQLIGKDVGSATNLRSKSLAKALIDEESYIYFKTLVNRCYLAVRQYAREICILVELMLRSGLPCFKPKQTIANLAKRLSVGKTEVEAAHYMRQRIHESRQNYRTVLYDVYQQVAEGIER